MLVNHVTCQSHETTQRCWPLANKRAKLQVEHKIVQEPVTFSRLLRFDSCISFGADFRRLIGVLLASDG